MEYPQIVISQSLEIFKKRALSQWFCRGHSFTEVGWWIEPKDFWGLFQIYDDVAIFKIDFCVFYLIIKKLAGFAKSSVTSSIEVASLSHLLKVSNTKWLWDLGP